jgi:trimethylamine--corrinoid protein Co-methyltransferase
MDAGLQGSLPLIAIANDVLGFLRAATAGVTVDDQTLALDVVEELGPSGDYLSHDHTFRHFRRAYYSKLTDKRPYSQWVEQGATTMEQRAASQVDQILDRHETAPLPSHVQQELKRILEREQAWADGQ